MESKVTWDDIYDDYKRRYPNLYKMSVWWGPYGYLTIIIYLSDGMKLIYDYLNQRSMFLNTFWK